MSFKLKLRLKTSPPPPPPVEPSRNSFTSTDYYRTTRDEIYSPISRVESFSPGSLYADLPQSPKRLGLAHIHEGSEADLSDDGEDGEDEEDEAMQQQQRVPKRTAAFWHVFDALFRKWRRQKAEGNMKSRKAPLVSHL